MEDRIGWDRSEMGMEWMRYLTLDEALTLFSNEFDLEKHSMLDQVCFILWKSSSFYSLDFILFNNMLSKQQRK